MKNALLVGESWVTITTHQKGFDHFSTVDYTESAVDFKRALTGKGWQVDHLPSHRVGTDFPQTLEGLRKYDVVVLSDIGSNTFLLPSNVFIQSETGVDLLQLLADYVRQGGGLIMVGGYMSFAGIEGKARYGRTVLHDVLPVTIDDVDDRVEAPAGLTAEVLTNDRIDYSSLGAWPPLLGYNRTTAKPDAAVIVEVSGDPLIAVGEFEDGRSAVFTSDLAPHWVTPAFVEWDGYAEVWDGILSWVSGSRA
ncbi:MAG: glutamine amidotransferase [Candidatus Microbacterium stercoravium]